MTTTSTFISDPLPQELPDGVELSGFYSSVVDLITAGSRGKGFTWALNGTDLSTDPVALQQAYEANPDPIDHYLSYVDIDKMVKQITGGDEEASRFSFPWLIERVPAFLAGAALGAGILYTINNY